MIDAPLITLNMGSRQVSDKRDSLAIAAGGGSLWTIVGNNGHADYGAASEIHL